MKSGRRMHTLRIHCMSVCVLSWTIVMSIVYLSRATTAVWIPHVHSRFFVTETCWSFPVVPRSSPWWGGGVRIANGLLPMNDEGERCIALAGQLLTTPNNVIMTTLKSLHKGHFVLHTCGHKTLQNRVAVDLEQVHFQFCVTEGSCSQQSTVSLVVCFFGMITCDSFSSIS